MIRVCLLTMIFVTQLSTIEAEGCDSFKNTSVGVIEEYMYREYLVNGCIEPEQFRSNDIKWARIKSDITGILRLGKNSIRNLPTLERVEIYAKDLQILESKAFSNLPSLLQLHIEQTSLEEIQRDVFNLIPNIKEIWLDKNKIDSIAGDAFSNLESLYLIDLSYNELIYWNKEWFANCPNLRVMMFDNNNIPTIPRRAFAALPKLKKISFEGNEITTIQPDAFRNLNDLQYLNLDLNRLTVIDEHAFPNNIYIKHLTINGNHLNYLPNKLLRKMSTGNISMDHNPWKCPCLERLNYWIYFTNANLQVRPQCKSPFAPICVVPQVLPGHSQTCQERVDKELTGRYIALLKNLSEPLLTRCARLD
ncbi:unnamed protein product [Phaedon cochleariae]|uniref:Uncharacterized protein n=1 Tax=Phaedon cochleariae TaxID=80249 RepID=A0A9P0DSY5_PHACE|nr:unnamed protein product [Phaedon cochleariae]